MMLTVRSEDDDIRFGDSGTASFQRTLRISNDGTTYHLPPGLDLFSTYPASPDTICQGSGLYF